MPDELIITNPTPAEKKAVTICDLSSLCRKVYDTRNLEKHNKELDEWGYQPLKAHNNTPHHDPSGVQWLAVEPIPRDNMQNENNPIIFVIKGTEVKRSKKGPLLADLRADAGLGWGDAGEQQRAVDNKLLELQSQFPNRPIIITGHSLGGSLATHGALRLMQLRQNLNSNTPNNIRAITFGDPGIGELGSGDPARKIIDTGQDKDGTPWRDHFVTITTASGDPVAGIAGRPAGEQYFTEGKGHSVKKYFSRRHGTNTDTPMAKISAETDLKTLHQELRAVSVSENTLNSHHKRFFGAKSQEITRSYLKANTDLKTVMSFLTVEIARLTKNDKKYAKEGTLKLACYQFLKDILSTEKNIDRNILNRGLSVISAMKRSNDKEDREKIAPDENKNDAEKHMNRYSWWKELKPTSEETSTEKSDTKPSSPR